MRLGAAEATRDAFRSLCNLDSSDKALQVALLFATEVAGRPLARVSAMNLDFDRHAFRRLRSIRLSKPTQQSACHALSHCSSLCISAGRTVMPSLCATCCRTLVQCTKKWLCRVRAAKPRRDDPAPNCQFCPRKRAPALYSLRPCRAGCFPPFELHNSKKGELPWLISCPRNSSPRWWTRAKQKC